MPSHLKLGDRVAAGLQQQVVRLVYAQPFKLPEPADCGSATPRIVFWQLQ